MNANLYEQMGGLLLLTNTISSEKNNRGTKENTISVDTTNTGYRVIGKGPSLVVLHGKFRTTSDYDQLCQNLANQFTIYAINRRNRLGNGVQGWITVCKKTG